MKLKTRWVFHWALTHGIFKIRGRYSIHSPNCFLFREGQSPVAPDHYLSPDSEHVKTKREAIEKAEELRKREIKSLRKRIRKLQALRFN